MSSPEAGRDLSRRRSAEAAHAAGEVQQQRLEVEHWNFQSPILPPAVLEQYNQLIPNFAERYFERWEQQSAHRQRLEAVAVGTQSKMQLRGQWFAFGLGALALVVAGALGMTDHEWAATAVVGLDFAGLGGAFIYSRHSDRKELEENARAVPDPSVPAAPALSPGRPQGGPNRPRKSKGGKKRR